MPTELVRALLIKVKEKVQQVTWKLQSRCSCTLRAKLWMNDTLGLQVSIPSTVKLAQTCKIRGVFLDDLPD